MVMTTMALLDQTHYIQNSFVQSVLCTLHPESNFQFYYGYSESQKGTEFECRCELHPRAGPHHDGHHRQQSAHHWSPLPGTALRVPGTTSTWDYLCFTLTQPSLDTDELPAWLDTGGDTAERVLHFSSLFHAILTCAV